MANSNDVANGVATSTHEIHTGQRIPDAVIDEIATSPNAPQDVPALLEKLSTNGEVFASGKNEKIRMDLLEQARALMYSLETPREAMIRYCWSQSTIFAAIEASVNLGLFSVLSCDDTPKSAAYLADATRVDPVMLSRILKHLAAMGVIVETGANEYRRTNFATVLSSQRYGDNFPCTTNCLTGGIQALPAFLKRTQYQNPGDGNNTAFKDGYRTNLHFFDYLSQNPEIALQFTNHMATYHQGRPSWMDVGFYPVPTLTEGLNIGDNDVLLVDVGGSIGHDLSEFRRKWPDVPGRLILQDLLEPIEKAKTINLSPGIEPMVHDFFTEQPVKGARAYYMHSILHDWNDESCRKILKGLIPAMRPGYSKILINENVIPSTNAYWETTSLDFIMMADFSSTERTEKHWHELIESVGLKITNIWTVQRGVESLIECELP